MSKPAMSKPENFCAVRGLLAHRLMCGFVGCGSDSQGRMLCHYKDKCEHQQPREQKEAATHQPTKEAKT